MITSLSPRQLGEALGVSESSLKRWANDGRIEVSRTAGGHRRIPLESAVRFIRQSGLPVVKPQLLGLPDLAHTSSPSTDSATPLQSALESGRAAEARAIVLSAYLGGETISSLCDGPIHSAMNRIGELWEHGDQGIFIEHRATDICLQALNQVRGLLGPAPPGAPVAVGGAPATDPYALPSLMAATTLASRGWSEMN
ncbi:MAG: hypothetical protein OER86_07925, partial [Phycisphaerae bacterium]|nr:hypothetical protein [Phycisphaerae bacterium]